MKSVDRAGVAKAILAFGGVGVLLFPFLAASGYRDVTYFAVAVAAVLAPWVPWFRGQPYRPSDVLLLGFLTAQVCGGMIQAFTDGSGEFGAAVSLADLAFLASYAMAAAGLGARVSEIKGPARTIGAIDAAVLLTGLMLMGGQFLLYPTLQASAGGGAVSRRREIACYGCGRRQRWADWSFSEKHDAIGCLLCDVWLEEQCGDCQFCLGRPVRPSLCAVMPVPLSGWS